MSVTCTLTRPVFRALPRRLSSIGAAIMRGKSVSTSTESTSFLHLEAPFAHPELLHPGQALGGGIVGSDQDAPAEAMRPRHPPDGEEGLHGAIAPAAPRSSSPA